MTKSNKIIFITFLVAAALFVGVAYSVLPHIVRYFTLQEEGLQYVPLTQESYFDVMNVHGGRYRDIVDGNIFGGEVDTYEYKDSRSPWPILSAAMLAPFFLPFKTIFPGIIISDFVFPILIFFSFFFIIKSLVHNRFFALCSSFVLMLFPQIPLLIPPSSFGELKVIGSQFFSFFVQEPTVDFTYLARESFIPGGAFFIFALFFIRQVISREAHIKWFVCCAGTFYGLLFYLYFYFWVFTTIILGLSFFILFFARERRAALRIGAAGLVGLAVSIPFWINQFYISELPHYHELIERLGLEVGRDPKLFLWKTFALFLFLSLVSFWLWKRGLVPKRDGIFLATLSLSGIIALEVNMVTGFVPQSDHWSGRVFLITNGILFVTLVYHSALFIWRTWVSKFFFWHHEKVAGLILAIVFLALLSGGAVRAQVVVGKVEAYRYTVPPALMDAYEWFVAHTSRESVVVSPSRETNIDIPVYTHNRILFARAITTIAPEEEVFERFYATYALFGLSAHDVVTFAASPQGIFYLFGERLRGRESTEYLRPRPSEERYVLGEPQKERIRSEYIQFLKLQKFSYRVDYLFIGPRERAMGVDEDIFRAYDKVYQNSEVSIYAI